MVASPTKPQIETTVCVLDAHLWALKQGLSPVPCHPDFVNDAGKKGKAPSVSAETPISWTRYQDKQPTENQVKAWASSVPGLGAILSGEFVVIDIDFNHLENEPEKRLKAISEMVETLVKRCPKLSKTYVQKSGSGGAHILVRVKDGQKLGTANTGTYKLMWEDVKVGEVKKGFIVLAPSMHESGNRYEATYGLCDIVTLTMAEFEALDVVKFDAKPTREAKRDRTKTQHVGTVSQLNPQFVCVELEQCLCKSAQNKLKGIGLGSDASSDLWAVATEVHGWEYFLTQNQIPFSGSAEATIEKVGEILGYPDGEALRKTMKAVEEGEPAADEKYRWLQIKKLNPAIFDAKCPEPVKESLKGLTPLEAAKQGLPLPLICDKKGCKLPTPLDTARYINVRSDGTIALHPTEKRLYHYQQEAGYWKPLEPVDAHRLVSEVIRNVVDQNGKTEDAYNLCWSGFLESCAKHLVVDAVDTPDSIPNNIVPFVGKWFDTESKTWVAPTKDVFITNLLPIPPVAGDYSRIHEWLMTSIEGDRGAYDLIRCLFYLILTGDVTRQVFYELVGVGGTGKSTVVTLLELMVGKTNTATSNLTRISGENTRFELAKFANKRLIYFPDQGGYGGSSDTLKGLTGSDSVSFERKNDPNLSDFKVSGVCVITANKPIRFNDESDAVDRRRILIKFMHKVSKEDQAKHIDFSKWLAEHLPAWIDHILTLDADWVRQVIKNRQEYTQDARLERLVETEPIAQWLEACVVVSKETGTKTPIGSKSTPGLYRSYCLYCDESNGRAMGLNKFGENLTNLLVPTVGWGCDLVYIKKERGYSFFYGLALTCNALQGFNPITKEFWEQPKESTPTTNFNGQTVNSENLEIKF